MAGGAPERRKKSLGGRRRIAELLRTDGTIAAARKPGESRYRRVQDEIRRVRQTGLSRSVGWSQTGDGRDLANGDDAAHEVSVIAGDLVRRQDLNHHHATLMTDWALPQRRAGEFFIAVPIVLGGAPERYVAGCHAQKLAAAGQLLLR